MPLSTTWPYRLKVNVGVECPSTLDTDRTSGPAASTVVAAVRRRSWMRTVGAGAGPGLGPLRPLGEVATRPVASLRSGEQRVGGLRLLDALTDPGLERLGDRDEPGAVRLLVADHGLASVR